MTKHKIHLSTTDFLVTQEKFTLLYDEQLDMLLTHPIPENLDTYYETKRYISHQDKSRTLIDKIYHLVKNYTLTKKVNLIDTYAQGTKTVLDIGTGTGDFLLRAKKKGWTTQGVEPNQTARDTAKNKDLSVAHSIHQLPDQKYQVITLWHVLEHLPQLDQHIALITQKLNDEGTLLIAVPNFKSYDAHYYKMHWAAYDTPRHLWHFSRTAISKLFHQHQLEVTATLPMYFDSYYVSLLSEKYKTGKSNYFSAFYHGFKSNLKARTSGEYSSIIYVLQKQKNRI